jgi:O-antigen/teichoic acid export membrane protein
VLRVAFVLLTARALGPEKFGIYALLYAVTEFLAIVSGTGYADYLTREAAKDERLAWGMASQLALLRVAIVVPAVAVEIIILSAMRYPQPVLAGAAWMALTTAPRALSESVQGALRGMRRYWLCLSLDLIASLALVAGGCFVLAFARGLMMVIATEIAAAALAGSLALILWLRLGIGDRTHTAWRVLFSKAAVFNLYPFTTNLYDRVDVVLLSKLAGDFATGVYSVAYRALGTIQLIPYGILYSLLPSVSREKWGDFERERLERAMGLLLCVAFVTVLAALALADPMVRLLLGARYMDSAQVLKYLIWASIPMYLNFALNVGLLATGRERVFLLTSSICLAVNFVGNLVLIPMFSWRAAAVLTVVTELVLLAQNVYWIRRAIGRIPLPWGGARASLAFVVLMAAALGAGRFVSMPLAGTVCLLFFILYLRRSEMLAEFARVWRARNTAGEPSCPS